MVVDGLFEGELSTYIELKGGLIRLPKRDPMTLGPMNRAVLTQLREKPFPDVTHSKKQTALSMEEIDDLYRKVAETPEVKESVCGRYNGSPDYGFCPGRALVAHERAILDSHLNKESILKLWAVGNMSNGWGHHVTTLVREKSGEWYALDPFFGKPLRADEWYSQLRMRFDRNRELRLFATPASRFDVGSWNKYNKKTMSDYRLYNFYADVMSRITQEITGKPGPWKETADQNEAAIQADKMLRMLQKATIGAGAASYGYLLYEVKDDLKANKPPAKKQNSQ
jgi:hypothetical protein